MEDEERFELSTFGLTNRCSAIELFIHIGPERLELSTPGVKDRYSEPIELRTNFVAGAGLEPASRAYETFELAITPNHNHASLAWPDSNQQPFAYKATALTIELQAISDGSTRFELVSLHS
jgi:hypothetical protein